MIDILLLLLPIIILIVTIYFLYPKQSKINFSEATELLCLFERNKVLPINPTNKWSLIDVQNTLRVWSRTLTSAHDNSILKIKASFATVDSPSEVVCNAIRDSKSQKDWNSMVPMNSKIRVIPLQAIENFGNFQKRKNISIETSDYNKENVIVEIMKASRANGFVGLLRNWIHNLIVDHNIERSWLQQNESVFWLLEHTKNFDWWTFYLVTTIDDNQDKCILNVITNESKTISSHFLTSVCGSAQLWKNHPADLIMGFRDYFENNSIVLTKFLTIKFSDKEVNCATDAHGSFGKFDTGFPKRKKVDDLKIPDISLFQKLKNMLEEKKDEVEQTTAKFRKSFSSSDSSDLKNENEFSLSPIEIIKRFSISGILFDDKKTESEILNKEMTNLPELKKSVEAKKRWSNISDAMSKIADEKKISKKMLHRTNNDQSLSADDPECDLIQCLDTMIDNAALDIIAEKSKIVNLNIKASVEDQAIQSGGWVYCGLEKDTVILKKTSDLSVPVHSYISKGMISCPPKLVYELLICPMSRLAYDDVIKDVQIIKEFDCGIKIVRLLYEIGQNFKRELHEFTILQGERVEGMKHIITLQSIDWDYINKNNNTNNSSNKNNVNNKFDSGGSGGSGAGSTECLNSNKFTKTYKREVNRSLLSKSEEMLDVSTSNVAVFTQQLQHPVEEKLQLPQKQTPKKQQFIDGAIQGKMFSSGWIIEPVMKTNKLCSMVTYISQMKLGPGMRTGLTYMSEDIAVKQPLCIVHLRNYIANMAAKDDVNKMGDNKRNNSVTLSLANALARFRNGSVDRVDEEEEGEVIV